MTGTIAALSLYSGRSFAAIANYIEMETDSRNALDTLTKDVRQAIFLTGFTTNQLTFNDYDGQPLTFTYSAADKTLVKAKGTVMSRREMQQAERALENEGRIDRRVAKLKATYNQLDAIMEVVSNKGYRIRPDMFE